MQLVEACWLHLGTPAAACNYINQSTDALVHQSINRQTDMKAVRQAGRQTDRQTSRQTARQTLSKLAKALPAQRLPSNNNLLKLLQRVHKLSSLLLLQLVCAVPRLVCPLIAVVGSTKSFLGVLPMSSSW